MPRGKEYLKLIPKIYKCSFEDLGMFFFVEAQKQIVPAITIEQSIYNFFRYIGEEDYNIESTMVTYTRIKKKYFEDQKS